VKKVILHHAPYTGEVYFFTRCGMPWKASTWALVDEGIHHLTLDDITVFLEAPNSGIWYDISGMTVWQFATAEDDDITHCQECMSHPLTQLTILSSMTL